MVAASNAHTPPPDSGPDHEVKRYHAEVARRFGRNSRGDSTGIRPARFFRARRGSRRSPLADYHFDILRPRPRPSRTNGVRPERRARTESPA